MPQRLLTDILKDNKPKTIWISDDGGILLDKNKDILPPDLTTQISIFDLLSGDEVIAFDAMLRLQKHIQHMVYRRIFSEVGNCHIVFGLLYHDDKKSFEMSLLPTTPFMIPFYEHNPIFGRLLGRNHFLELLVHILSSKSNNLDKQLTLDFFIIEGFQELYSKQGARDLSIHKKVYGLFRAASLGGDCASLLSGNKFCLVREMGLESLPIKEMFEDIFKEEGLSSELVLSHHKMFVDRQKIFKSNDVLRSLTHSITRFSLDWRDRFDALDMLGSDNEPRVVNPTKLWLLRDKIAHQSFDIVMQPIVDVKTQNIHHYEVLTRMKEFESIGDVIAFAEDIGLAEELDIAVCQKTLREYSKIFDQLKDPPSLALNISARSLQSDLFVDQLRTLLYRYARLKDYILFEITETVHLSNFNKANKTIQLLRQDGYPLCLDDLGAGSTSFQSLYNLEVDYIKIDGRCLKKAMTDVKQYAIIQSIVSLCEQLHVHMIGEQVENLEEARFIEKFGIEFAQGFLFGEPLLMEEFVKAHG